METPELLNSTIGSTTGQTPKIGQILASNFANDFKASLISSFNANL